VTQTIRALAAYKNASAVSIYLSMPTAELQTTPLLEQLFADGTAGLPPPSGHRWPA